jgi:cytochrome P450
MPLELLDPYLVAASPHPTDVLRPYREHEPVHWGKPLRPEFPGCWYLTRYDDIVQLLRGSSVGHARTCPLDRQTRSLVGTDFTIDQVLDRWFVFLDPPEHERLRSTISKGLQTAMKTSRHRIEQAALDIVSRLPRGEAFDLLPPFAYSLSVVAMADVLGLPARDTGRLIGWAGAFIQLFDQTDAAAMARIHTAFAEFFVYVREIIDGGHPAGQQDLLGNLLLARESGTISDDEVLATAALLLLASAETTPTLIGHSVLLLLQNPGELEKVRQSPELMERAVDEVLRFESPVQFTGRHALVDMELRGQTIRRGDYVVAFYNSANRDPEVFEDAETFNIERTRNRHLGFGTGIHNCVGGGLGHLIGQIAVQTLVTTAPGMRLNDRQPAWRGHGSIRGLRSLPVTL